MLLGLPYYVDPLAVSLQSQGLTLEKWYECLPIRDLLQARKVFNVWSLLSCPTSPTGSTAENFLQLFLGMEVTVEIETGSSAKRSVTGAADFLLV